MKNYVIPKLEFTVKTHDFNKNGIAIGYRPTLVVVIIRNKYLGIDRNLYNKVISVSFKKFIRPEKKFKTLAHKKKKIDVMKAKIMSKETLQLPKTSFQ